MNRFGLILFGGVSARISYGSVRTRAVVAQVQSKDSLDGKHSDGDETAEGHGATAP